MRKYSTAIAIIIGFVIFSSELVFGVWMAHWHLFIPGDAISRVANAYYVEYSRDPHLAAIGFVWNPLPSLLMLPILLFKPWLPELASEGIAAVILTAIFAAGASVLLYKNLIKRKCPLWLSLMITLCFAFNPFIFLYGSNGMSEMIFIFFLMLCVTSLLDWMDDEGIFPMTILGFALALAFLTRYEAVLFGFFLSIAVALLVLRRRETGRMKISKRTMLQKLEASEIIIFLPAVYAGVLWMLLNKSIMGDALFFLHSNYSNLSQSEGLSKNPYIAPVIGHLQTTLSFVAIRSIPFLIPLLAIVAIRLMRKELFRADFSALLLLIVSIPIMQAIMLFKGASYGWLRFFVYPLPLIAAWLPYEIQKQGSPGKWRYRLAAVFVLSSLAVSCIYTWSVMQQSHLAPEEYDALHYKRSSTHGKMLASKKIAQDLDKRIADNGKIRVLTDSFNAYQIILYTAHPHNLIVTSDRDFKKDLNHPVSRKVTYILVPKPDGISALNAVSEKYHNFYYKGTAFAKLDTDYGNGWRLYRVIRHQKNNG